MAAESDGPHASIARTETRAVATDPVSSARFRRYWSAFSPGIVLIRRIGLRLVKKDAELSARRSNSGEITWRNM